MLLGANVETAAVASAIRDLGHDPAPWTLREGWLFVTSCQACGACGEAFACDGATYAQGRATMAECPERGRG